ncbi:MAG: hypothetical protein GY820_08340 [Gammaproteobacteria bacterium]|nr:hypothetical protein [Gammaproteobacteria bacterium]
MIGYLQESDLERGTEVGLDQSEGCYIKESVFVKQKRDTASFKTRRRQKRAMCEIRSFYIHQATIISSSQKRVEARGVEASPSLRGSRC